jgi:hypothetical protein
LAGKDLGKSGEDAEKYQAMIWVAPYAHLFILAYGQAFAIDGTHCMTQHGWRAIPLCVLNSLGNPIPIGIVWAPTENLASLTLLCRQIAIHCKQHGVDCPFKEERQKDSQDPRDLWKAADWVDPLVIESIDVICFPPLRNFVKSVLDGIPDLQKIPAPDSRATFMSDGGPAFRSMGDLFNVIHLLCKKHLAANSPITSSTDE